MLKYVLILMVFLGGCSMSYEEVNKLEQKCKSLGGIPIKVVSEKGKDVFYVDCQIDGVIYREGKY